MCGMNWTRRVILDGVEWYVPWRESSVAWVDKNVWPNRRGRLCACVAYGKLRAREFDRWSDAARWIEQELQRGPMSDREPLEPITITVEGVTAAVVPMIGESASKVRLRLVKAWCEAYGAMKAIPNSGERCTNGWARCV